MNAYLCFVLGLIAFHLSAALFGWIMFNWVVSTFVSSCVIGSLYLLVRWRHILMHMVICADLIICIL